MPVLPLPGAIAWLEAFDHEVLHALNCRLDAPALEWVLTHVQDKAVGVPLFLGVVLVAAFVDRRRALRAVLAAAVAYALCMGAADLMWGTLARPRPARVFATVVHEPPDGAACAGRDDVLVLRRHSSSRAGMPSRHALSAAAFAATLWGLTWWLGVAGALTALLVACGRVYAGVHWPTDVLVGLVLGTLAGWAGWRLVPALLGRHRTWVTAPTAPAPRADPIPPPDPSGSPG